MRYLRFLTGLLLFAVLFSVYSTIFAASEPVLSAGTAEGKPGDTVCIPVSIENNSGIIALYCSVGYDDTQLKLNKVTNGTVLTDPAHSGSLSMNPYRLCFDMSLASTNNKKNGVIAELEFEILSTATAGDKTITIDYFPNEIYDYDLNNVSFKRVNGKVSVVSVNNYSPSSDISTSNGKQSESSDKSSNETWNSSIISVNPSGEQTPWDKVTVSGENITEKNITIEQTDDGLVLRGDNLSGVTVEIDKKDKFASVKVDTEQKEILLREDDRGQVEISIDDDDDGIFETSILEPQQFEDVNTPEDFIYTVLKILIPVVISGLFIVVIVFIRKKRNHNLMI